MKSKSFIYSAALVVSLMSITCSTQDKKFQHNLSSGATPWTLAPTGRPDGQFTFAVIGDLNSGERDGVFEVAVEQLRLLQPELILSIGDL